MNCKCGAKLMNGRSICYVCELERKIAEDKMVREATQKRAEKITKNKSVDKNSTLC